MVSDPVETLERRDCPAGQLTLQATVLPGHFVELTGHVSDMDLNNLIVDFDGAVDAIIYADSNGDFSLITQNAVLGEVTAVASNGYETSDAVSDEIALDGPHLSFLAVAQSQTTATLYGQVESLDASALAVVFQGVINGWAQVDAEGSYAYDALVGSFGTVQASVTDLWGQASEIETVTINRELLGIPPQLTLNAQVLPDHQVQLTGTLSDADVLEGFVVSFYGAAGGSTMTDADGNFSLVTDEVADLGAVYAWAENAEFLQSETVEASLSTAAPTITLTVDLLTPNAVTVSGTVTGIDLAGRTVTLSGIANGTAVTDANGNYVFTGYVTGTGSLSAATVDRWAQQSNTATTVVSELPTATFLHVSLFAQVLPGHQVKLTGQVIGGANAGVEVEFSGAVEGSTLTDANGYFSYSTNSAALGTVIVSVTDEQQPATAIASATIAVPAPVVTLTITEQGTSTVTLTGSVAGLDIQGVTIAIGGVANDSVVTDAAGNFTFTTSASEVGNITASTTDLWGNASNVAVVQNQPGALTTGANVRGAVPAATQTRAQILATMPRWTRNSFAANRQGIPAGWNYERVIGTNTGFKRGRIPANTLLGPTGCGPCVGVIIYYPNDPLAVAYAFHFGFSPSESPSATFQREIIDRNANWANAIAGDYRAVVCGAQTSNDPDITAQSTALLQAAVNGIRNTLGVTITAYVAGPAVAVDRDGNLYWPLGPDTPVNGY